MQTTRLAALISSLPLFAFVACAAPAIESEQKGQRSSSVINGDVSTAADDAVVLLSMGQGICTGTLIAPNLVLTARHCVSDQGEGQDECAPFVSDKPASSIGVSLGAQPKIANAVAKGTKLFVEPNATICGQDIALIVLDRDVPNITPREVRFTPPVVGELTVAVGYGQDENEQLTGRKTRSGIAVQAVGPAARVATAQGQTIEVNVPANDFMTGESVCFGDSGGPLFDAKGAVLGTTSRGTPLGCVGAPALFSSNAAHAALIKAALIASGHPLTTTADAGADATVPVDAATPGTSDAGASPVTPDEVGDAPGSTEEAAEDEKPSKKKSSDSEDDEDDDKPSKSKSKGKTTSLGAVDDSTVSTNGCAASPGSGASGSVAPFLLALAALVSLRRRPARREP